MMNHDEIFRYILIAAFVLVIPMAASFRIRSQRSRESLDRTQEGLFILLTLRPVALLRVAGLVAFMIQPRWMDWSAVSLPLWLRWAGVPIGVLAATLLIWTMANLGKNLTDTVVTRKEHALVTSGPYHWVRHPFYVAYATAALADSLVTANAFLAVTGAIVFVLLAIRTRIEEAKLIERFGESYRDYMRTTPRFFPRLTHR